MLKLKVSRWGNSLAVRLPVKICEMLEISDGDKLILTVKDGEMVLQKDPAVRPLRAEPGGDEEGIQSEVYGRKIEKRKRG